VYNDTSLQQKKKLEIGMNPFFILFYFIFFKKGLDGHIPSSNMKGRKKLGKDLTIELSRGERERESMKKW
jgi:hypothetical protein